MRFTKPAKGRNWLALSAGLAVAAALAPMAHAADVSGDLVLLNWASGSELELIKDLEQAFVAKYPKVNFKNTDLTVQGDPRGAIRSAMMSGEKADLFINTWPAYRKELVDANMLRPIDQLWDQA